MKIITQLVILTLSLLLVNTYADDQYCSSLIRDYKTNCTTSMVTIDSCCDLKTFLASGVYKINKGTFDKDALAYCDMVTDGGGWIVIQRNKRSSAVNFNRQWVDYEKGFGDLNTEFWYGLEELHCLTQRGQWEMRVDFQKTDNTWSYLRYTQFSVGSANDEYPLTVGGYSGSISSSYAIYFNGRKFSTPNNDNDGSSSNCAASDRSGWWQNSCRYVNLNYQPPYIYGYSVIFSEMKIRPRNCAV